MTFQHRAVSRYQHRLIHLHRFKHNDRQTLELRWQNQELTSREAAELILFTNKAQRYDIVALRDLDNGLAHQHKLQLRIRISLLIFDKVLKQLRAALILIDASHIEHEVGQTVLLDKIRSVNARRNLDSYSALAAWRKSGAEEVLRLGPDASEFAAIKRIISALMDEGPMPGLSALENREEIIRRFLSHAGNYAMTAEDCDIIRELRSRFIENEEIRLQCDGLLEKPASEEASLKEAE